MPLPLTQEKKEALKCRIFTLYARYGFNGISMDEIAKSMHVGKPTLYKYFKSKEDIVRQIEETGIGHLESLQLTMDRGMDSVLDGMSQIYSRGIILASASKKEYMSDLQSHYPDLYEKHMQAVGAVAHRFQEYYRTAVEAGYCRSLSIQLVGEQFRVMLPSVISAEYLEANQFTLNHAIREYYRMLLHQVVNDEYQPLVDREENFLFCDPLANRVKETFYYEDARVKIDV